MLVFLLAFLALVLGTIRLFVSDGRLTAAGVIMLALAILLGAAPALGVD